ncbi:MAG: hypothetical protein J6W52_03390 [Bacteroidaceae bacterium]|nr:hypothetical protein [Bacteroidaceae bacterium]
MKQKLILLILALVTSMGMWAKVNVTVTLADQTDLAAITNTATSEATATHKYGTYSGSDVANTPFYTKFTTNSTSNVGGVEFYSSDKILKPTYVVSSLYQSDYGHVMAIQTSGTTASTFTLSAPSGFTIKSYRIKALSTSGDNYFQITPAGGAAKTAKGITQIADFSVDVNASSTTLTVQRVTNTTSTLCISQFTVTLVSDIDITDENKYISAVGDQATSLSALDDDKWYALELPAFNTQVANYGSSAINVPNSSYILKDAIVGTVDNVKYAFKLKKISEGLYYLITSDGSYVKAPTSTGTMALTRTVSEAAQITFTENNSAFVLSVGTTYYLDRSSQKFYWHDTNNTRLVKPYELTITDYPSITFDVYYKNASVKTSDPIKLHPWKTLSSVFPSNLNLNSCTYTFYSNSGRTTEITTVPTSTSTVYVTCEWDGLFDISDTYEDAHWYDMAVRSTWYVTSDETDEDDALSTVNANALGLATDPYQWAFVGNPYYAKLYNKDKGEDYVYAWTSASNQNIPTFVDASTGNSWTLIKSTATGYTNAFQLTIPDYGYQVNQFGGEGGSLKIWADTRTTDSGSAFEVFDVPDDFSAYVTSEIAPYMESEAAVFNWTSSARTAIGYDAAYKSSCTFEQYKSMKETLLAKLADQSNFTLPESGKYYTVKNVGTNKYLYIEGKNSDNGSIYDVKTTATMKPACVVKVSTINSHPYFLSQGLQYSWASASPNSISENARAEATGKYAHYYVTKPGQGAIAFVLGNGENLGGDGDYTSYTANSYYRDNGSGVVIGGTYNNNNAQWVMEEITSVSIPMNYVESEGYSYGTMYLPYDVTVPSYGETGFVTPALVTVEGTRARLNTSMKTQIPANIPILLAAPGELSSTTATFATSALDNPVSGDNDLEGTYFDKTTLAGNEYVFGTSEGELGFWKLKEGKKLAANKAYLVYGDAEVKGYVLSFDDDTDAIVSPLGAMEEGAAIYNLAGQRLQKMQRGVNIVNGKKIVIK